MTTPNIEALPGVEVPQLTIVPKPSPAKKPRFKIIEFDNRSGSKSWRVTGIKRDGSRVRENFQEEIKADHRLLELETEYLTGEAKTQTKATKLTDHQIDLAERAFARLGPDAEDEIT